MTIFTFKQLAGFLKAHNHMGAEFKVVLDDRVVVCRVEQVQPAAVEVVRGPEAEEEPEEDKEEEQEEEDENK